MAVQANAGSGGGYRENFHRKAFLIEEVLAPARYRAHTLKTLTSHYCLCCGRPLTDPVSLQRRIGPECATKPHVAAWLAKHWGHLALAEA